MSRPCLSSRGPKPPVAPKPKLSTQQEGEHSQCIVTNGDVASELELAQDSESESTQDEADPPEETHKEDLSEQTVENLTNHDGVNDKETEEVLQMGVEDRDDTEAEEEESHFEVVDAGSLTEVNNVIVTTVSAAIDHIIETDDIHPQAGTGDPDDTADDPAERATAIEYQTGHESEANNVALSPYEEIEESTSNQGSMYAEIGNAEELTSDNADDTEEPYFNEREFLCGTPIDPTDTKLCEEGTNPSADCNTDDTSNAVAGFSSQAVNGSQPSLCEEYPYDVIGPLDDTSAWQPERATKDESGRFRFSEGAEDAFEPYSVIEVVPADLMSTSDPELECTDEACSEEKTNDPETKMGSNQEPFYVSSVDVAEIEEEQAQVEDNVTSPDEPLGQELRETSNRDSVDEYADIEDVPCQDGDEQQLECVSSEDYVEIGDEDESVDMTRKTKGKSTKERSAIRRQSGVSKRNSCQPRLRLCDITVPPDLDLGRTPELTNRLVFAHTTEAFEEDIEDLDCHIVPFFEDSDSDSDEHIYEEAGFDSEGENFITLDRKTIVTRSRSLSGKVPGYVPETVPEETGNESQTHDYYTVDQNGDIVKASDNSESNRAIPPLNSRRFLFYPRSYSAEGRDMTLSAHLEGSHSPRVNDRVKRTDDTLSLPCVITSSGSFSQRSHQSSSGVSTPTSLVDIPPPFELAYITKRPITKSSPSLLIQHEPNDKPKKKKTSFKRFLGLKFRRKTDSKSHGDGSVRSSRSSSESSHHGPVRVIELDRRSNGSSPQLQSRIMKPQRSSDFSATFVVYKDGQKKKGVPKTYGSRGISRVESFEDRSRPPFMPLPLTKPRSISFPSADTSDYENIPAMSSDYENIQIPQGRPTRAVTITEFFDDQSRTANANENDGYVDMNSFAGIENKNNTQEQETERYEIFSFNFIVEMSINIFNCDTMW